MNRLIRPWRLGPGRLVGRPRSGGAWQKVTDKENAFSLSVILSGIGSITPPSVPKPTSSRLPSPPWTARHYRLLESGAVSRSRASLPVQRLQACYHPASPSTCSTCQQRSGNHMTRRSDALLALPSTVPRYYPTAKSDSH